MELASSLFFDTQFALGRLPYYFRLKNLGKEMFKPFIQLDFENEKYQIKTANCPEEIIQVLRLRFEVFFQEFSTRKVKFKILPYDIDLHDFLCDHLIVKDKETGNIVACYRLLSSDLSHRVDHYYSESEFNLDEFLKLPGKKLELGRACVQKEHRTGAVIGLLWKGLCTYAKQSNTRYLFGCSSINRTDFEKVPQFMGYLSEKGFFLEDFNIGIQKKYDIENHPAVKVDFTPNRSAERMAKELPSLLNMYLMAGAKVSKKMAYDAEMDCLDIMTILDLTKMSASFERRFAC